MPKLKCLDKFIKDNPELHQYLKDKSGVDFDGVYGKDAYVAAIKELQANALEIVNDVYAQHGVQGEKGVTDFEKYKKKAAAATTAANVDMDDVQHNLGNTVPAAFNALSDLQGKLSESGTQTAARIDEKLKQINALVDNPAKFSKEEALRLANEARNMYNQLGKTIPNRDQKVRSPMSHETEEDVDSIGDVFDRVGGSINRTIAYLENLGTNEQITKPIELTPTITETKKAAAAAIAPTDIHKAAKDAGIPNDQVMDISDQLTGKRHLDDMTETELEKVNDYVKEQARFAPKPKAEGVVPSGLKEPSLEQQQKDILSGNMATLTYEKESDIPEAFKDKISSRGTTNGKPIIRVTVAQSLADYELAKGQPQQKTSPIQGEKTETKPAERTEPYVVHRIEDIPIGSEIEVNEDHSVTVFPKVPGKPSRKLFKESVGMLNPVIPSLSHEELHKRGIEHGSEEERPALIEANKRNRELMEKGDEETLKKLEKLAGTQSLIGAIHVVRAYNKPIGEKVVPSTGENLQDKESKPTDTAAVPERAAQKTDTERVATPVSNAQKREEVRAALIKLRDAGLLVTADKSLLAKARRALGGAPPKVRMSDAEINTQMRLLDAMSDVWKQTTGNDNFFDTFIEDVKAGDLAALQAKGGALFQDASNVARPITRVTLAVLENVPQFQKMKGQQVTPQSISDLVKSRGKQIEKDIINEVLGYDKYKGQKKISFDEFRGDVETQVMKLEPIESSSYATYGRSNLGDEVEYGDAATIIFNSPIDHGKAGHFSGDFNIAGIEARVWEARQIPGTDTWAAVDANMPQGTSAADIANYVGTAGSKADVERWMRNRNRQGDGSINKGLFGHIRQWFDKATGIFHLAELQSDYFQKNKASDLLASSIPQHEIDEYMNVNWHQPYDKEVADKIIEKYGLQVKEERDVYVAYDKDGNKLSAKIIDDEPLAGTKRGDQERNQVAVSALQTLGERYAVKQITDAKDKLVGFRVATTSRHDKTKEKEFDNSSDAIDYRDELNAELQDVRDDLSTIKNNYDDRRRHSRAEEQKYINQRVEELKQKDPKFAPLPLRQFIASQKVHETRLFREALRHAADQGAETLRFPSPYTIAVIEGYVDKTGEGNMPYEIIDGDEDRLEPGDEIRMGNVRYTVIDSGNSWIEVAPTNSVNIFSRRQYESEETSNRIGEIEYDAKKHFEDMDAITEQEVEDWAADEWMSDEAKDLLKKWFKENPPTEKIIDVDPNQLPIFPDIRPETRYVPRTVAWSEIYSDLEQYVEDQVADQDLTDIGYDNVYEHGDTVYAAEGHTERFDQPAMYGEEKDTSHEGFEKHLNDDQKTVVNKYKELGAEMKKLRPDATTVTDENGMGWLETKITDADRSNPVIAFQQEGAKVKAAVDFSNDTKATVHIFDGADISSLAHEINGHIGRRMLEQLAKSNEQFAKDYAAAKKWAGVKDNVWTTAAEEKFARGFERYLREGKAPTSALRSVFDNMRDWLYNIYTKIKDSSIDVKLTPEITKVFDRLLSGEQAEERQAEVKTEPKAEVKATPQTKPVEERKVAPVAANPVTQPQPVEQKQPVKETPVAAAGENISESRIESERREEIDKSLADLRDMKLKILTETGNEYEKQRVRDFINDPEKFYKGEVEYWTGLLLKQPNNITYKVALKDAERRLTKIQEINDRAAQRIKEARKAAAAPAKPGVPTPKAEVAQSERQIINDAVKRIGQFDEDALIDEAKDATGEDEIDSYTEDSIRSQGQSDVVFKGAMVEMVNSGENEITLYGLRSENPGQGEGGALMDQITQAADEHGITLKLHAGAFGKNGLTQDQLVDFYKRRGFTFVDTHGTRLPQTKQAEVEEETEDVKPTKKETFHNNVDKAAQKLIDALTPKAGRGLTKQGVGVEEIIKAAANIIKTAYDVGSNIADAVEEAIQYVKDAFAEEGLGDVDEKVLRDHFKSTLKINVVEGTTDDQGQQLSGIKKGLVSQEALDNTEIDKMSDADMMDMGKMLIDRKIVKPEVLVTSILTNGEGVLTPNEVVALIRYKADLDNDLRDAYAEANRRVLNNELPGNINVEIKELERKIDDFEVAAIITANQQSMAFRLRRYMLDRNYNVNMMIDRYKKANQGYIPASLEAKWRERDRQLKDLKERIAILEKEAQDREGNNAIENIQEDVSRKQQQKQYSEEELEQKAQAAAQREIDAIYEQQAPEKKRAIEKAIAALQNVRKKLRGGTYSDATGMVAIIDAGLVTIENALKLTNNVAKAIEIGIAKIKQLMSDKGITKPFDEAKFRKDALDAFEAEGIDTTNKKKDTPTINEDGTISIPNEMLRNLVERGITDINDLTDAVYDEVSKKLPGVSKRQVRDAITNYGKKVNPTADQIQQDINNAKIVGRLLSELEDLQKGIRKTTNPSTRAKMTQQEKDLKARIKNLDKEIFGTTQRNASEPKTHAERLQDAKDRVQKSIERIQAEIDNKKRDIKNRTDKVVADAELAQLRDQEAALKRLRDQLLPEAPDVYEEEKQRERLLDRLTDDIVELDEQIAAGEKKIKEKKTAFPHDAEVNRLRAEKKAKQDLLDELDPRQKEAVRIKQAIKSAERSLAEYERRLREKDTSTKARVEKPTTAELDAARSARDAAKQKYETFKKQQRAANKVYKSKQLQTPAQRLASAKKRTQTKINELKKRLANKDFAKKTKPLPISDPQLDALNAEKEKLQEEFTNEQFKEELKNRTVWQKWEDRLIELFNGVIRGLVAAVDLSAPFVQGAFRMFGDLGITVGQLATLQKPSPNRTINAFGDMFRHLVSEKFSEDFLARIKASPNYNLMKASKLALDDKSGKVSAKEGMFISNWINIVWDKVISRILGLGTNAGTKFFTKINPYRASGRAFDGYVNSIRVQTFGALAKQLGDEGYNFETHPTVFKKAADFVNTTTGRGSLGQADASGRWLNIVLFAPRKVISEFKLYTPYAIVYYARMPKAVRMKAMKSFGSFIGTFMVVNTLLWAARKDWTDDDDDDNFWNMNSTDFLTHKFGNKRLGFGGGMKSLLVFMSRFATGKYVDQYGKESKLGERPMSVVNTRWDLLESFVSGKFSPALAAGKKYLDERKGREVDQEEILKSLTVPIWLQDIKDLYKDSPKEASAILTAFSIFGANVRTLPPPIPSAAETKPIKIYDPATMTRRDSTPAELKKYKDERNKVEADMIKAYKKSGVMFDEFGDITTNEKVATKTVPYDQLTKEQIKDLDTKIASTSDDKAKKNLGILTKEQARAAAKAAAKPHSDREPREKRDTEDREPREKENNNEAILC